MSVETSVSRDVTSAALNTAAHATEHCAIDADTLAGIGSALGRQVLVERSPELLALYTVDEISATPATTFAGAEGIERLMLAPEPDGFRAVLRTRFIEGQGQARLTEELLARGAGGLAILAPHGGAIERGTDDQALSVYAALRRDDKPASAWIARGFNPATGAHTCWHITSSASPSCRFPGSRCSSPAGRLRTPSRFTAMAATRSSSAAGCRPTARTPRSSTTSRTRSAMPCAA